METVELVPKMKQASGRFRKVRLWLAVVGAVALIVYGFCCLIVPEISHRVPNEATGHTHVYEMHRGERTTVVYVKPSFHWTSEISRLLAIGCLGLVAAELLATILVQSLLQLLPDRFEALNSELAQYRQSVGPRGVAAEGLRYVAAWRDLKRRRALFALLFCGGVGMVLLAWAIDPVELFPIELVMVPMVLTVVPAIWTSFFRCPRCGNRYQSKAGYDEETKFCTHCGLPEDSPPTTAVAPDFEEWKKGNQRV